MFIVMVMVCSLAISGPACNIDNANRSFTGVYDGDLTFANTCFQAGSYLVQQHAVFPHDGEYLKFTCTRSDTKTERI